MKHPGFYDLKVGGVGEIEWIQQGISYKARLEYDARG